MRFAAEAAAPIALMGSSSLRHFPRRSVFTQCSDGERCSRISGGPLSSGHGVGAAKAGAGARQTFALYRLDGAAVVLSDICVHRGGSLSGGTRAGDRIVCPYHGWEYRPDERARDSANLAGVPVPKKRADSYPTLGKNTAVGVPGRFSRSPAAADVAVRR